MNILGIKYMVIRDESLLNENLDGVEQKYSKVIRIVPKEKMLNSDSSEAEKTLRYKEVLRHEIIHAFFDEAGLSNYSENEQLVDWLAVQIPKMCDVFKEQNCLD